MGEHIIDVMDDGTLNIDSQGFSGNMCEASLHELITGLDKLGIKATGVNDSKKTSMLADMRHRVRT